MASNRKHLIFILCFSLCLSKALCKDNEAKHQEEDADGHRKGKLFSLFNIVQFKNTGCTSTESSGSGGGNRAGTCYTSSECQSKGGRAKGNCAAGFGVCCTFVLTSETATTVNQNETYIENPGSPAAYAGTGIAYTINKQSADICYLRLDFIEFTLTGIETDTTNSATAGNCIDTFQITATPKQTYPEICGENAGQHVYIDIGAEPGDKATLTFTIGTSTTTASVDRSWDIKVSQIACASRDAPPRGCLQYHRGPTGRFTTFNFLAASSGHLPNQRYSVCIRQEAGFCCNRYQVCPDFSGVTATTNDGFSLSGVDDAAIANLPCCKDDMCSLDYIGIADSAATCLQSSNLATDSRYCGLFLSNIDDPALLVNSPVCDCTAPFAVDVVTDAVLPLVTPGRGVCLEWSQVPCN